MAQLLSNAARVEIVKPAVQSYSILGADCVTRSFDATRALFFLQQAAAFDPSNRNEFWRGTLNWLKGNCDAALGDWQTAITANTRERVGASIALGWAFYQLGDRSRTVAVFKQAGLGTYLYRIAYWMQGTSNQSLAVELYELAVEVAPTYQALTRLGELYVGQGLNTQARALWRRVLDSASPAQTWYWLAVAEIALLDQKWNVAAEAYGRALAQQDHSAQEAFDLLLRQGRALEKANRDENAITAYEQAIQIAPRSSSAPYTSIALIRHRQGDRSAAFKWLARAMDLFPGDPWPPIHTGNLAAQLGDKATAKYYYDLALRISPGHQGAIWALESLK